MPSSKTLKGDKWRIALSKDSGKFYEKAPEVTVKRLNTAFSKLSKDPFMRGVRPVKSEKGVFRLRVGNLRLLFGINKEDRIIEIYAILPRSDAYKKK